jgi:hypothetical protein
LRIGFSGDSTKFFTSNPYYAFDKPIYTQGKKALTTQDTTNKWLPKTGTASNSNLIQGKDTTWIKAQGGGSTVYANSGVHKDGDTIKLSKSIFIPQDSTFQIFVNSIQTFQTNKDQTYISSPSGTNIVALDDITHRTLITGTPIELFSGTYDTICKFTTGTGTIKALIDNSGNIDIKGQYKIHGTPMILKDFYTDASTSGTGETDLYSYTVPANTLANNGDKIEFTIYIDVFSSGTPTTKLYFAGNAINLNTTESSTTYNFKITIIRTSSNHCRGMITGGTSVAYQPIPIDLGSLNWTTTNIIKITGQVPDSYMASFVGYIEFKPAAQ